MLTQIGSLLSGKDERTRVQIETAPISELAYQPAHQYATTNPSLASQRLPSSFLDDRTSSIAKGFTQYEGLHAQPLALPSRTTTPFSPPDPRLPEPLGNSLPALFFAQNFSPTPSLPWSGGEVFTPIPLVFFFF